MERPERPNIIVDPEFSRLIPPLSDEELWLLEHSILVEGCRDALIVWAETGILLDGHNRKSICEKHNLTYRRSEISLPDREAAADWIDANQLGRRNLTADQASLLRGRRYNRTKRQGTRTDLTSCQVVTKFSTADDLAEEYGVSARTIKRDGKRAEMMEELAAIAPEEAEAVWSGEKRFNEVRRTVKVAEVKEAAALPTAKFRVLYADPPWKYGDQLTETYGATRFHYPSMTIDDLCAMPIRERCEADAVLFLWVTSPILPEAFPVVDAWGFDYKASFVWDKGRRNWGHYNGVRHEFLLVCTRGSCLPDVSELVDSVQAVPRSQEHSRKPEEFREIIDRLYPHGRRLELFARGELPSRWEGWGNEA